MKALIVLILSLISLNLAFSHDAMPTADAPMGWSYPVSCCADNDCREVSSKQIGEEPKGYLIRLTGEFIGYSDDRLKNSPDGIYHWCSVAGADDSRTICLFVPPRGF